MTPPAPFRVSLLLATAALASSAWPVQAQQPSAGAPPTPAATATPKKPAAAANDAAASEKNAASYSLGVSMGDQLRSNGIPPDAVNSQRLAQGVHDALTGKVKMGEADQKNIQTLVHNAQQGAAEANHAAATKFLAENGKKPGVVTTASGLQYKVLAPGSGESPKATDEATVNYRGTLLDGTEFDSSYKRGQPASFVLGRVIPGWTEGLQLMKPGAKYQLFVPPQLAYGDHARPGLPPGSLLTFEVELLSFKPAQAGATTPPAPSPSTPPASSPPPK
jgi:FKBP-type peptidyl-prolyl cis-trans isomerase